MSSLKQITANRRNALNSTGPTTSEGKGRSRRNALRHGLTSETVITALEDAEDYQAFEAAVIADYEAETAVERELVLRLAGILWRLRRATAIETALFEVVAGPDQHELNYSGPALIGGTNTLPQNDANFETERDPDSLFAGERRLDPKADIGDRFLRLMAMPTYALDRLSRYEHLLCRQARQIIITLESSQHRYPRRTHFPFSFHAKQG